MKIYYKPVDSDEPYKEVGVAKEPIQLHVVDDEVGNDNKESAEHYFADVNHIVEYPPELLKLQKMRNKYPRKLKKAIGSWWRIKHIGDEWKMSFQNVRRTKWQRKAQKLIRHDDNGISVPMKGGYRFIITKY